MKKKLQHISRKRSRRLAQLQRERTLWAMAVRTNWRRLKREFPKLMPRMVRQGRRRRNRALMALAKVR